MIKYLKKTQKPLKVNLLHYFKPNIFSCKY